ncbi:MAG: shikimate kinase [Candidatus Cloacimonetes bacterium]|nr:shikimate kinase [Candidatus Cloacimonadota bacterium]
MKSIVLIGHRASGKSTVGFLLARELNLDFVDTDQFISSQTRVSVSDIFMGRGENSFRELEERALLAISRVNTVIACGGGTPMYEGSYKVLSQRFGICIYLKVSPEQLLLRRMNTAGQMNRPLLPGYKDVLDEVYNTQKGRNQVYENLADISYDCTKQSVESTVSGLVELLTNHRETGKDLKCPKPAMKSWI